MPDTDPLSMAMKRNMFGSYRRSFFPATRMSERDDLNDMLNQQPETAFLGKAQPSPTPSPTPKPTGKSMGMNEFVFPQPTSAFRLAMPPRTLFRQPTFQSAVMQTASQLPVGALELGMPAPRFNLLRSQARGGFFNPVFQLPQFSERNDEFRF